MMIKGEYNKTEPRKTKYEQSSDEEEEEKNEKENKYYKKKGNRNRTTGPNEAINGNYMSYTI